MDQAHANVECRRAHERFPINVDVEVKFIRQSKEYPTAVGEPWRAKTIDFSRSGACLATPWPLARGDVLELRIKIESEPGEPRVIHKHAVVMNVRCDENDVWTAGVRFVSHADQPSDARAQPAEDASQQRDAAPPAAAAEQTDAADAQSDAAGDQTDDPNRTDDAG